MLMIGNLWIVGQWYYKLVVLKANNYSCGIADNRTVAYNDAIVVLPKLTTNNDDVAKAYNDTVVALPKVIMVQ